MSPQDKTVTGRDATFHVMVRTDNGFQIVATFHAKSERDLLVSLEERLQGLRDDLVAVNEVALRMLLRPSTRKGKR